MSQRLFAAHPAEANHFVSVREMWNPGPWGPWVRVIAWGFSEYDSRPIPVTLRGQPKEDEEWRIKTPEGTVVEV
jgi:hypothetical protein